MQRSIVLGMGLGLFAVAAFFTTGAEAKVSKISKTSEHRSGELVVKLHETRGGSPETEVFSNLLKHLGPKSVLSIEPFLTDSSAFVVKLARDHDLTAAIHHLKKEKKVEIAEPNAIYHAFDDGIPNDPEFSKTWGLQNTGQKDSLGLGGVPGADIHVLPLWSDGVRGSRNVVVAVIDTGIDWEHPDLKANLYTHPGEIADDKIDNDGNGFVDDVHGWNFISNTPNSVDDNGHGSHCAGTIGGVGNNGVGVAGVNWEVSLLPVKFLDASGGGTLAHGVEAINYAKKMKANVMSNSWGGGSFSDLLLKSIEGARDAGIVFAVAAGNDGTSNDSSPEYPASFDSANIIAVAATDHRDQLASFSNFGSRTVHVAAPGVGIYSTSKNGEYKTLSGTSMATPHVAGLSALLLSVHPEWTFSEIKERLIHSSDPLPQLLGKVKAKGRVNAYRALQGLYADRPEESAWVTVDQILESEHPYKNNASSILKISQPGAKWLRVHFEKIEVESRYDHVLIEMPDGQSVDEISGKFSDLTSEYVAGEELQIHLKSDVSNTGYGFKIDRIQFIPR